MADQVPFKVYTFWNEADKPEVRRFGVEESVVITFHYLNAKLQDIYPGLKGKCYTVSWKDEDGDDVVVSSDEEVMTAVKSTRDTVKLSVHVKAGEAKEECDEESAGASAVHYGVVCDSCDSPVVGFRYKCTSCEDFDLCSRCEAAGRHPEHCMVRVPAPNMPRTIIRAAVKRSRHFLKTVANAMGEECAKKHRRERSGERKHRGHHGHHGFHGDHAPHGGDHHHRRQRASWLDTFATYMNEFANLAGDIDLDTHKPETKPQEQKAPETKQTSEPQTSATGSVPNRPEPSTSANTQTQCPVLPVNINQIKDFLEILSGGLNMQVPQAPTQAAATQPQAQPTATQTDVEMGQGDRKSPESDQVTVKSETSSASSLKFEDVRDASPDKADDWTMINKEKDLMDAAVNHPTPIGFNLPQEFQERVKISEGGLYPPLHTSTAEAAVPSAAPSAPAQAPPAAEKAATPPPQPRPRHPKAHIDAAIQHMLAMGFTNEGGWLTQLLESKDGNIAAVLDLLTPVNPKP